MTDTFPRQQARTRHFSLGAPRSFQISADGSRVAFLRSKGGSDPVTCLWVLDLASRPQERAWSADPADARDRRRRGPTRRGTGAPGAIREQAGGVVAFATDAGSHDGRVRARRPGLHGRT